MANRRDDVFVMTPPESESNSANPSESNPSVNGKESHKHKKHRRGILLSEIDAFFLGVDGGFTQKGKFKSGRLLKINTEKPVIKDDIKYYLVENITHPDTYITANKENFRPLKGSDIISHARKMVDKIGATGNQEKTASAVGHIVQKLTNTFEEPSMQKGLDSYTEGALSGLDGFSKNTIEDTAPTPENETDATVIQTPANDTQKVIAKKLKNKKSIVQKNATVTKESSGLTIWKVVFPFRGIYDFISRKKQQKR